MLPGFMEPSQHIPWRAVPFVCNNQAKNIFSHNLFLSLKHRTYSTEWNTLIFSLAHITDTKISAIYVKLSRREQGLVWGGSKQSPQVPLLWVLPARNRHKAELFPQPSKEITLDSSQLPNYEAVTELSCHLHISRGGENIAFKSTHRSCDFWLL